MNKITLKNAFKTLCNTKEYLEEHSVEIELDQNDIGYKLNNIIDYTTGEIKELIYVDTYEYHDGLPGYEDYIIVVVDQEGNDIAIGYDQILNKLIMFDKYGVSKLYNDLIEDMTQYTKDIKIHLFLDSEISETNHYYFMRELNLLRVQNRSTFFYDYYNILTVVKYEYFELDEYNFGKECIKRYLLDVESVTPNVDYLYVSNISYDISAIYNVFALFMELKQKLQVVELLMFN